MSRYKILPGTFRISIHVPGTELTERIICGNNYKFWWDHAREYIYSTYKNPEHGWNFHDIEHLEIAVEYASNKFVDDGGLKWCKSDGYQEVINEVFEKYKPEYIPEYKSYTFEEDPDSTKTLIKKLREY